ncbi:MAG: hypothetical protein ACXVP7_02695 [Actinomycetota bacterium]
MNARRVMNLLLMAFALGVVAALVKGQSGDGRAIVSQVRSELGNLSAPWVLIAWFAGTCSRRIPASSVFGLAATTIALGGFYLVSGVVEPMDRGGVVRDVGAWISANRVYFEAGLLSGPVFGALGGWWARRRSPGAFAVAGLLMIGEPLVLWLTGAIFPNGVLSPLTGLPLVVRIVPAFGLGGAGAVSIAVHVVEIVGGIALLVVGRRRRERRAASTVPA